jgi:hypothetical protein
MSTLSSLLKNSQVVNFVAGSQGINQNDLVYVSSLDHLTYAAKNMDYVILQHASTILAPTVVSSTAIVQDDRNQIIVDPNTGNIIVAAPVSGGSSLLRYSDIGSALNNVSVGFYINHLFFLSNGNICAVGATSPNSGTNHAAFAIYDLGLNLVHSNLSIGTLYLGAPSGLGVGGFPAATPLSGGGFAMGYIVSGGLSASLTTFDNTGTQVLAPTAIQTFSGTISNAGIKMAQLSNANLAVCFNTAQSVPTGLSFVIVTTAGVSVVANTVVDALDGGGTGGGGCTSFIELSVLNGVFCVGRGFFNCTGAHTLAMVYSNAGVLQGTGYTSSAYSKAGQYGISVKILNDGTQFWVVDATNQNIIQVPATGTGALATQVSFGSTESVDAAIAGSTMIVISGTQTGTTYWAQVQMPDPTRAINSPQLDIPITSLLTSTTTNAPRVITTVDQVALLYPDNNGTELSIVRYGDLSIVGLAGKAVVAGSAGTLFSVNTGPGAYSCNLLQGSTRGVFFDHSTQPGNKGSLFSYGVHLDGLGV